MRSGGRLQGPGDCNIYLQRAQQCYHHSAPLPDQWPLAFSHTLRVWLPAHTQTHVSFLNVQTALKKLLDVALSQLFCLINLFSLQTDDPGHAFTCSHKKGPLLLNESQLGEPRWIWISMKMEVRSKWQRWGEEFSKVWTCSFLHNRWRNKKKSENRSTRLELLYVNIVALSPCGHKSFLSVLEFRFGLNVVVPQFSAGSLCHSILLWLKCHLWKKKRFKCFT